MSSLIAQYFLNHRLELDEIRWQMEAFARQGYHGVYAHARPGLLTPYMSVEWWTAVDTMVDMCDDLGLEFWIWDEDYYPSGLAGGRVAWEDPGLISRDLEFTVQRVQGPGVEMDFNPGHLLAAFALREEPDGSLAQPMDVTAHCGTRRQRWGPRRQVHRAYSPGIHPIGHPHWRTSFGDNRFALVWDPPDDSAYVICGVVLRNRPGVHPDLLRPEGIQRFIELSYEPYAERYAQHMGRLIKGAFTDEPSPGTDAFPWSATFPDAFQQDHGYDIVPMLAHLALDIDDRSPMVRHHYRLTQHRLQTQHYLKAVGTWCREHTILFAGHLSRTEWLSLVAAWWPNELRCYRDMDIPSCDPLGASEGWTDAAAYHTGVKVASSAAHLFGKAQAGSDCVAVIGDEASLRDLKYHFDYQMALGINHFTVHGLSYSIDGPRKDEVPPSIFYQHTQWQHMGVLLGHVASTAEALTGGSHLCAVAVLYPSTSLACQIRANTDWRSLDDERDIHALSEFLLSHQVDFDFIDEVTLREALGEDGRLSTPEAYTTILLPYLRYVDARTVEALERFADAGGTLIAVGRTPQGITARPEAPLVQWTHQAVTSPMTLDQALLDRLPRVPVKGQGAGDLFVLRREQQGRRTTFVFNRAEKAFRGKVGERQVQVAPRGSLLYDDDTPDAALSEPVATGAVSDISAGWTVSFEANHLPLAFWHASEEVELNALPEGFVGGRGFNLMLREQDPLGESEGCVRYDCRFMLSGPIPDARLVMEDSTVSGDWTVFVNGIAAGDWRRARVFDCCNIETPVADLLRAGTTPSLNVVSILTKGPGRGLHEMPYLYGSFECTYRYGHLSFPFLKGGESTHSLDGLLPWNALGYPTYSGSAIYRRTIIIDESGDYVLDLGRVEDCAAVCVDGETVAVLPWKPYRCTLRNLSEGEHTLQVEVSNPPANRNRAAGLVAGLLGPVRVTRL